MSRRDIGDSMIAARLRAVRLTTLRMGTFSPKTQMTDDSSALATLFIDDTTTTFRRQKELAERAMAQITDEDFFRMVDAESNSIAIIAKHIGGNLRSRFTDFLTADGEKPDRDRDGEFIAESEGMRADIMAAWDAGWSTLFGSLGALRPTDLLSTVHIRAEPMTVVSALHRALAHVSQHVGQIVWLAKYLRSADWKTLSIPRGQSAQWRVAQPPR